MFLATPIWLLALIPWTALAIWMLWGRRERVNVPFLALWRGGDVRPASSRAVQPPPLPILLLLLCLLLAILAAGSPTRSEPGPPAVAILVDRGATMSARDGDAYRYAQALRTVMAQLGEGSSASVIPVPAGGAPGVIPPTALDTTPEIEQAVLRALRAGQGPVVAITDRPLGVADPRLIHVRPSPLHTNVGITHVAAREKPVAQVMVTVDAQPPSKQTVRITSDGHAVQGTIDAPGTAFIDVPRLGRTVEVALAQGDALPADDRAWLVRQRGWPRIEAIGTLPAELSRMVETYAKLRPPLADARVVSIVADANDAPGDAVILTPTEAASEGEAPQVVDHPITAGVAWAEVLKGARIGAAPPAGFMPLVTTDDRVVVAVREAGARNVWVALESELFPRRANYVVFWTNVFDWLGRGGGETFEAHRVGLLGKSWRRVTEGPGNTEAGLWPGLYERGDGTLRAVNAPPVTLPPPPAAATADWRDRLSRLLSRRAGGSSLGPYLLLIALGCALGAALSWRVGRAEQT